MADKSPAHGDDLAGGAIARLARDELNGMRRNVIGGSVAGGGASGYGLKDILEGRFIGSAIVAATHNVVIPGLNGAPQRWD